MKKILVVDDDPAILEVVQVILEDSDYLVTTSLSGKIFNKLDFKPDIILLDVLLSGEDGRDILKKLKSDRKFNKVPIIMLSAHPSAGDSVRKLGASDFISKPFDIDYLLVTIEKHLSKASISDAGVI